MDKRRATPTAKFYQSSRYPMIFRPGNYVYLDMVQVSLGAATLEECAMTILATIISKPAKDRLIIDAGKKTLTCEKDAAGKLSGTEASSKLCTGKNWMKICSWNGFRKSMESCR